MMHNIVPGSVIPLQNTEIVTLLREIRDLLKKIERQIPADWGK